MSQADSVMSLEFYSLGGETPLLIGCHIIAVEVWRDSRRSRDASNIRGYAEYVQLRNCQACLQSSSSRTEKKQSVPFLLINSLPAYTVALYTQKTSPLHRIQLHAHHITELEETSYSCHRRSTHFWLFSISIHLSKHSKYFGILYSHNLLFANYLEWAENSYSLL